MDISTDIADQIKYLKKNESLLVKQIDSSLENYIASCNLNYVSYTPPSTDQNFRDLDKYCGDIVASLGTVSALVLEVKYNSKGHLNDLNPDQKSGLIELYDRGVPVFYSYNADELSRLPKGAAQQLMSVTAIEPPQQMSKLAITDPAQNLKDAVDRLLNNPPSRDVLAFAMACFVNSEESIINSGIEKLTTKALLLIYDQRTRLLATLSKDAALHVIERVMNTEFLAESKNSTHLADTINQLLSAWHNELDSERKTNHQQSRSTDFGPGY